MNRVRNCIYFTDCGGKYAGAPDWQQYFEQIKQSYGSGFMLVNLSGYRGKIRYEMANHASTNLSTSLGNVLTVVSDKKLTICSSGTFVSYAAEVISATDYSPFGAPLAGRTFSSEGYRC